MADNKVSVEITLEEKAALKALAQLSREVQKTETTFVKMGDKGEESLETIGKATKGVSTGLGSLVGGVTIANLASNAIMATAGAIKNFAFESINAAAESEESTNRLGQALRATGSYSEAAVEDFKAYAEQLSLITKYDDDAIISQIALAKSFGASNEQAKNLVEAATNLAATFGGSLDSRVEQLGKTLQGTGGKLDTLIPGFKNLTEEQLRAGAAFEKINTLYGGAASNEIDTYAGKLAQLNKALGEIQETIGGLVINSGVADVFSTVAAQLGIVNQALSDSQIASNRANGGMKETSETVEQLKRKYEELAVNLIDVEQYLINPSMWDKLVGHTSYAKENIESLRKEVDAAKIAFESAQRDFVTARGPAAPDKASVPVQDDAAVAKEKEKQEKLVQARAEGIAQLEQIEADHQLFLYNQYLASAEGTTINREEELANLLFFEQQKIDAAYNAEMQKSTLIKDEEARRLAEKAAGQKKLLALDTAQATSEKRIKEQSLRFEQEVQAGKLAVMGSAFALAGTIAKDGSREQFLIQKAAAAAQVIVATAQAMALAAATPPGLPVTAPVVAWAKANGAIQLATIAASTIKGFEKGGVIGGTSFTGDNVPAMVNSGEMILNDQQQGQLFKLANGQGSSVNNSEILERLISSIQNQAINLVVDGRVLATVLRGQIQSGFKLT